MTSVCRVAFFGILIFTNAHTARADDALARHQRGRYLVQVAGCNDCHTPGYGESGGKVPESEWLTGVPIGWHGPWGTTYAGNLRILANAMDEKTFVARLKSGQFRPPMPGYVTKIMLEEDLQAIYVFIKSLGVKGEVMPAALPPEIFPKTPILEMTPQTISAK